MNKHTVCQASNNLKMFCMINRPLRHLEILTFVTTNYMIIFILYTNKLCLKKKELIN